MGSFQNGVSEWRLYPYVSFAGAATSIIFVTANVCHEITRLLSRQKYACSDKHFVTTKLSLSRKPLVVTNIYRDKHVFVATNVLARHSFGST